MSNKIQERRRGEPSVLIDLVKKVLEGDRR